MQRIPAFLARNRALACAVLAAAASIAHAAPPNVTDVVVRANPPGTPVAAGYLVLRGGPAPDALVRASASVADRVEFHSQSVQDGIARMRPVGRIDVPAGAEVRLSPGGLHLMFVGLRRDLVPGESIDVTLEFERGGTRTLQAVVRPLAG